MANGVIIESRIQATNIDALNRTAQATVDVAGGGLVSLAASGTQGNEVWTATAPASGTLGDLWIAYNPSAHHYVPLLPELPGSGYRAFGTYCRLISAVHPKYKKHKQKI